VHEDLVLARGQPPVDLQRPVAALAPGHREAERADRAVPRPERHGADLDSPLLAVGRENVDCDVVLPLAAEGLGEARAGPPDVVRIDHRGEEPSDCVSDDLLRRRIQPPDPSGAVDHIGRDVDLLESGRELGPHEG
jgi:hypothetical protein